MNSRSVNVGSRREGDFGRYCETAAGTYDLVGLQEREFDIRCRHFTTVAFYQVRKQFEEQAGSGFAVGVRGLEELLLDNPIWRFVKVSRVLHIFGKSGRVCVQSAITPSNFRLRICN